MAKIEVYCQIDNHVYYAHKTRFSLLWNFQVSPDHEREYPCFWFQKRTYYKTCLPRTRLTLAYTCFSLGAREDATTTQYHTESI